MQLIEFGLILIFTVLIFTAFLASIILSKLVSPRNSSKEKTTSFECGEEPSGVGRGQFAFRYYPYLLMFLVFDVSAMFLFTWAGAFSSLGLELHIFLLAFLLIVLPPVAYAVNVAGKAKRWK
ncbi:MAG: NADH-quinone oxidoreductase subunit A [Candidatus Thorarchaeota archaeon]